MNGSYGGSDLAAPPRRTGGAVLRETGEGVLLEHVGGIVGTDPHVRAQRPIPRLAQHRDPGASRLGRKIDADVAPVHRIRLASTAAA